MLSMFLNCASKAALFAAAQRLFYAKASELM